MVTTCHNMNLHRSWPLSIRHGKGSPYLWRHDNNGPRRTFEIRQPADALNHCAAIEVEGKWWQMWAVNGPIELLRSIPEFSTSEKKGEGSPSPFAEWMLVRSLEAVWFLWEALQWSSNRWFCRIIATWNPTFSLAQEPPLLDGLLSTDRPSSQENTGTKSFWTTNWHIWVILNIFESLQDEDIMTYYVSWSFLIALATINHQGLRTHPSYNLHLDTAVAACGDELDQFQVLETTGFCTGKIGPKCPPFFFS